MPKDGGLTKNVVISYGGTCHVRKPVKQKTTANRSLKQVEKEREAHAYEISGLRLCTSFLGQPFLILFLTVLSFIQWEHMLYGDLLKNNHGEDTDVMMADVGNDGVENDSDWEDEPEVQDGLCQLPPGEEGFLQSHADGEAILQAVMDGITLS